MSEPNGKSIYGDAEARRRRTLDAAAELLDEGGYAALTIRSVAARAGTSTGLIYQYFADKQDIFAALLDESQIESTTVVAALPRTGGVAALIASVIPETARQWGRLGRLAAVWRDLDRPGGSDRPSVANLRVSAERYNTELLRALTEAADAEGRVLRTDPSVLPFVLSGLMGIADTLVNNWADHLDSAELIAFTAEAITRGITIR